MGIHNHTAWYGDTSRLGASLRSILLTDTPKPELTPDARAVLAETYIAGGASSDPMLACEILCRFAAAELIRRSGTHTLSNL